jgi:regulatory LuxR family protein
VNEDQYTAARARVLSRKDPPQELLEECRSLVRLLIRTSSLPPLYSPYGVWSDEAIEEVFADWVETRLVRRGQLLALVQRAPALRIFRRMAETSVRQHLVDSLRRSQSANLFERVTRLLVDDERFESAGTGATALWRLRDEPAEAYAGDDRGLLAMAWSLGNFHVIRYELDARKLSPLLDAEELDRFLVGILKIRAMDISTLMRALRMRFAIDEEDAPQEALDFETPGHQVGPEAEVEVADLVTATLAELTQRQAEILMGLDQGESGSELAARLGCSTGTVSHERRHIEDVLTRLGTDAPAVLKQVLNALFGESG